MVKWSIAVLEFTWEVPMSSYEANQLCGAYLHCVVTMAFVPLE